MEPHAIPCLIMASITFYVGFYHLFMYIKRPRTMIHLPFALTCFSVGLYDIFCMGLYNADSLTQGIFWQRLQLSTMNFISIFIIIFIALFTKNKKNWILRAYLLLFLFLFVLSLAIDERYTLSLSHPGIKHILIPGFTTITYYEAEVGPLFTVGIILSITVYTYLIFLLIRYYFRSKDKNAILIICGQVTYFIGVINDSFVASGLYEFVYISEYSFLIIILTMAYVLLNEFVSLHSEVEEYTVSLEQKVQERTEEINKLNEELKHQAEMDALTGIYNRRFFNEYFELEIRRAQNEINHKRSDNDMPNDMNFGLAILDIDNFKKVNDTHGHLVGDRVLVETAAVIKKNIFTRDVFCRYGGEEFILLFTRTSKAGIIQAAEKVRTEVEKHSYYINPDLPHMHITISIGAVTFDEVSTISNKKILEIADDRLLLAKKTGKNKIVVNSPEETH